jgi:peptidoglycan hydrolase-like protein with peptidoglycan-binding domain
MQLQDRELQSNMRGDDVALLHQELIQLGYTIPDDELREQRFGKATRANVLDFQKQHGLETTGVVDTKTAALIAQALDGRSRDRQAAAAAAETPPDALIVRGQVVQVDGRPVAAGRVRAFDRDLRSEEPLGDATTDEQGRYELHYSAQQFQCDEKGSADLRVVALDSTGSELASSPIMFNAPPVATIDLVIGGPVVRGPSEYEQLLAAITPALQGLAPADLTEDEKSATTRIAGGMKKPSQGGR